MLKLISKNIFYFFLLIILTFFSLAIDLKYSQSFGGLGTEAGRFLSPLAITFSNNNFYLTDIYKKNVQVFSANLSYLFSFSQIQNNYSGQIINSPMTSPQYLIANNQQQIIISDQEDGLLYFFDKNGRFLKKIGDNIKNRLRRPSKLAYDSFNNLYVLDIGQNSLIKISNNDQTIFSLNYQKDQISKPLDFLIDSKDNFYLLDGNKINKYNSFGYLVKTENLAISANAFAIDQADNLWFLAKENNLVALVSGNKTILWQTSPSYNIVDFKIFKDTLYLVDNKNKLIHLYNIEK